MTMDFNVTRDFSSFICNIVFALVQATFVTMMIVLVQGVAWIWDVLGGEFNPTVDI